MEVGGERAASSPPLSSVLPFPFLVMRMRMRMRVCSCVRGGRVTLRCVCRVLERELRVCARACARRNIRRLMPLHNLFALLHYLRSKRRRRERGVVCSCSSC